MKKLISLVLALALVLTFAVSAFADVDLAGTQITNKDNEVVRVASTATEDAVYRVELTWDCLDFEYALGDWNTETHRYNAGSWVAEASQTEISNGLSATVAIKNHSNRDITYQASLDTRPFNGVAPSLTNTTETTIIYCEEIDDYNQATYVIPNDSFEVQITGDLKATTDVYVIGNVTVAFTGLETQNGEAASDFVTEITDATWQDYDQTSKPDVVY